MRLVTIGSEASSVHCRIIHLDSNSKKLDYISQTCMKLFTNSSGLVNWQIDRMVGPSVQTNQIAGNEAKCTYHSRTSIAEVENDLSMTSHNLHLL